MKKMNKLFIFACCLILAACSMGSRISTMDTFHEVDLSATTEQVKALLGTPYAIRTSDDGCVEYEYIERIPIGARDAETRHYFIQFQDGKVVSKRVKQSSPLPYFLNNFDSYDMQTTQNTETETP